MFCNAPITFNAWFVPAIQPCRSKRLLRARISAKQFYSLYVDVWRLEVFSNCFICFLRGLLLAFQTSHMLRRKVTANRPCRLCPGCFKAIGVATRSGLKFRVGSYMVCVSQSQKSLIGLRKILGPFAEKLLRMDSFLVMVQVDIEQIEGKFSVIPSPSC